MLCGYDTTVGTLTEFLDELIFRVDYEVRIESGEGMPLHAEASCSDSETVVLVLGLRPGHRV